MRCLRCGHENAVGKAFCSQCGQRVPATAPACAQCATELRPHAKFCSACGFPVATTAISPPLPRAETSRKQRRARIAIGGICAFAVVVAAVVAGLKIFPVQTPIAITDAIGPDWTRLPVAAQSQARISPLTGGTISLPDGTLLQVPPGAVDTEIDLTLKKFAYTGPERNSSRFYDIEPDGLKLKVPATLAFSFDPKPLASIAGAPTGWPQPQARVAYFNRPGGWQEVPATVDSATGTARVQTAHFSTWVFSDPIWALIARQNVGDPTKSVLLPVPYYSQGSSKWCWGAATQMLLKHYGVDAEIWDIAREIKVSKKTGVTLEQLWNGTYANILEKRGLPVERSALGWSFKEDLTGYLIYELLAGRPVWVGLPNVGHVIVVVGFSPERIYFNDPSGQNILLGRLGDQRRQPSEQQVNPTSLSWADWYKALGKWDTYPPVLGVRVPKPIPVGLGLMHTVTVVNAPPAPTPPLTLSIFTDDSVGLSLKPGTPALTSFIHNGALPRGYDFTYEGSPDIAKGTYGLLPALPSNSDILSKFTVHAANSLGADTEISVQLLLDGLLLRQARGLSAPKWSSNKAVDLLKMEGPHSFAQHPLRLGEHSFELRLFREGDEQPVDRAVIEFQIGPAKPTGLTARRDGDKVKLAWNANPEQVNGWADISYTVWEKGVARPAGKATTWEAEPGDLKEGEDPLQNYRVEATAGALTSSLSDRPQMGEGFAFYTGSILLQEPRATWPDQCYIDRPILFSFKVSGSQTALADATLFTPNNMPNADQCKPGQQLVVTSLQYNPVADTTLPYSLQSIRGNSDLIKVEFSTPPQPGAQTLSGTFQFVQPDGSPRSSLFRFDAPLKQQSPSYNDVFKIQGELWRQVGAK